MARSTRLAGSPFARTVVTGSTSPSAAGARSRRHAATDARPILMAARPRRPASARTGRPSIPARAPRRGELPARPGSGPGTPRPRARSSATGARRWGRGTRRARCGDGDARELRVAGAAHHEQQLVRGELRAPLSRRRPTDAPLGDELDRGAAPRRARGTAQLQLEMPRARLLASVSWSVARAEEREARNEQQRDPEPHWVELLSDAEAFACRLLLRTRGRVSGAWPKERQSDRLGHRAEHY